MRLGALSASKVLYAIRIPQSLQKAYPTTDFLEALHREVEILSRVCGAHLAPDARVALRYHRIAEARHEDPFVEHHVTDLNRERRFADDDWHDRRVAFEGFEPGV